MLPYQVQALLLRAKADTGGIEFIIDSDELAPGEFSLKVEDGPDALDQEIIEIRVNGETALETVSLCVNACTSCESRWIDFLSNVPLIGLLVLKIRGYFIYSRYRAEFG